MTELNKGQYQISQKKLTLWYIDTSWKIVSGEGLNKKNPAVSIFILSIMEVRKFIAKIV